MGCPLVRHAVFLHAKVEDVRNARSAGVLNLHRYCNQAVLSFFSRRRYQNLFNFTLEFWATRIDGQVYVCLFIFCCCGYQAFVVLIHCLANRPDNNWTVKNQGRQERKAYPCFIFFAPMVQHRSPPFITALLVKSDERDGTGKGDVNKDAKNVAPIALKKTEAAEASKLSK
jgi:hypothetical protein